MHAVFDVHPDSKYRKDFWYRYDLPTHTAAQTAQTCIGDWIVFRQTGKGRYISVARVVDVVPDQARPGFFQAVLDNYLPFTSPVPFKPDGRYAEADLLGRRPEHVGRLLQGIPVRSLWPADFLRILEIGFSRTLRIEAARFVVVTSEHGVAEPDAGSWDGDLPPRTIQETLVRRAFRDANFRIEVCSRYRYTCAFSGMNLNDGTHHEVQAAHAWSVHLNGPDIVQNGVCACGPAHWAYDHHLISVSEDYRLLIAPRPMPPKLLALLLPAGDLLRLPLHTHDWPDQAFLKRHRDAFKEKHRL